MSGGDGTDDSTFDTAKTLQRARDFGYLGLSILCHPDLERVGEVARLLDASGAGEVQLCRSEPQFREPSGRHPRPLETQRVSRLPVTLELRRDGSLQIVPAHTLELLVDGKRIDQSCACSREQLQRGILLQLGKCVLLRLSLFDSDEPASADVPELIGDSLIMRQLRAEISRVSDLEFPVLLRGETGVGKELVAAALHRLSPRRAGPYVCVNMAALTQSMAAAELFGHAKGAFTGAIAARDGYFAAADGGTLFLDEIGVTAPEVQPVLLRALEAGVIQPIGGDLRSVSVRLITATDANLENIADSGRFSHALRRRLGYEIRIPPLRERGDDVALLFAHFLVQELRALGEHARLGPSERDRRPLLTAQAVTQLVQYAWPGNVRQLRDVARHMAVQQRGDPSPASREPWQSLISPPASKPATPVPPRRAPQSLTEAEIRQALAKCDYAIERTARELGVSRSWLHARIEELPGVRKAKDLTANEIRAALAQTQGDLGATARVLEVSAKGLQLQMKRLGLSNLRRS